MTGSTPADGGAPAPSSTPTAPDKAKKDTSSSTPNPEATGPAVESGDGKAGNADKADKAEDKKPKKPKKHTVPGTTTSPGAQSSSTPTPSSSAPAGPAEPSPTAPSPSPSPSAEA